MNELKHSPLPWMEHPEHGRWIKDAQGTDCCMAEDSGYGHLGERIKENREFIVRACNANYALVEALEKLVNALDETTWSSWQTTASFSGEQEHARAVLALAKGDTK